MKLKGIGSWGYNCVERHARHSEAYEGREK